MQVRYCLVNEYQEKDRGNVLLEDSQPSSFNISEDININGQRYMTVSIERDLDQVLCMNSMIVRHTMYVHLSKIGK